MHRASCCYTCCRSLYIFFFFFFFSSRRRHTRWPRDWSSDVCSSDLTRSPGDSHARRVKPYRGDRDKSIWCPARSEERRVGKEGRSRWSKDELKNKPKEGRWGEP